MSDTDQETCANHPETAATSRCAGCGRPLCLACGRVEGEGAWCDGCAPGTAPAPVAPPAPREAPRARLPAFLYLVLLLQGVAAALAAWAAWHGSGVALELERRLRAAAAPAAPALPGTIRAPRLELQPGAVLRGSVHRLEGSALDGEVVALVVDGSVLATSPVREGRFVFAEVPLLPGEHSVGVVAYGRAGPAVEEPALTVRVAAEGAELAAPAPTPGRSPRASPRTARNILRGRLDRQLALTFDGGSNSANAAEVLDTLRDKGVRCTVFLTGEFIRLYPHLVRRILADGHEVGNHSWSHPHLADWVGGRGHVTRRGVTREFLLEQLASTARIYEETVGAPMSRYWRAPYGEVNREILGWAAEAGWVHVGWTSGLDTLDWVADPGDRLYRSAEEIRDRLIRAARNGEAALGGIVLMHLGGDRVRDQPSMELPRIIDGLRAEGFRLVTVSSLLGS